MPPVKVIAFAACLLLPGCGRKGPAAGSPPSPAVFHAGDFNAKGRLIFWTIDAYDHTALFVLHDDEHGVVLYNDGTEAMPEARYIYACQSTGKIVHTKDLTVFKRALTEIPRGTVVGRYDTCSVPRDFGLPPSVISTFEQALEDTGLKVETEYRRVCYCPGGS